MGTKEFLKNRPAIEVIFWTLLVLGEFVPSLSHEPVHVAFMGALFRNIPLFLAVHLWYYLFSILKNNRNSVWILSVISIILIFAAPAINYLAFNAFFPTYRYESPLLTYVLICSPISLTIIGGCSLVLFTLEGWLKEVTDQANLKSEKLLSEIRALKSQINPHFLFNTLNNIYFYACSQHPQTPNMIEKLSEILRYLVYEGEKDRVSLKQEIDILQNLIDLYKIKNSEQKNITLQHKGVQTQHQIAPLILVNLLENAFKHSDALNNPKGFIHISAEVTVEGQFVFRITNSTKPQASSSDQAGVGQFNIEKQIELIYQDHYSFHTDIDDQTYRLELILPLQNAVDYALPHPHRG
ncbi:MAG: sensor histidine kinase [Bacteroidota bacterium]